MTGPASIGRAATADDLPAVTTCLTSAFSEDPLWGEWAFPDIASRPERLGRLMEFWAQTALRHGWVRMSTGAETVAVWIPPGVPEMTAEEEPAFAALVDELFAQRAADAHELFELFERSHPREQPHYYLSLWGTHRDHAGAGLGAALIDECLELIDAQRMPCYLESTNPANIARYEALGFTAVGSFARVGGPPLTTMWRDAN